MNSSIKLAISGVIFLVIFYFGFLLAGNKPLWKDESYSITQSVAGSSYADILVGKIRLEGNNSPLFYISQKILCDIVSYDPRCLRPVYGRLGRYYDAKARRFVKVYLESKDVLYDDLFSNYLFRVIPVFLMALTAAGLFYYFSFRYSLWSGCLSMLLCFSSWLFWWYGLEARPYIYIFAFSTLQILIVLEMIRKNVDDGRLWLGLGVVNFLLILSSVVGIVQIVAVSLFFVIYKRCMLEGRRVFIVFLFPILIGLFYYWRAEKYGYYFLLPILDYFFNNIPYEIIGITGLFVAYCFFAWLSVHKLSSNRFFINWLASNERIGGAMVLFFVLWCFTYVALLLGLRMVMRPVDARVFYFAHRYLIGLVPLGVVAMTVFSGRIFVALRPLWAKSIFVVILITILVWRFINFYNQAHFWVGI